MARINVPFVVKKQHITQPTRVELMSDGRNYFYATFTLCDAWENISDIKAVFCRDGSSILMPLTESADCLECKIPWEVMTEKGVFEVGIFGGDRLLTNLAYVKVGQGCVTEGKEPKPPTPDWYAETDRKLKELSTPEWEDIENKPAIKNGDGVGSLVGVVIDSQIEDETDFPNTATADNTVTFGKSNKNSGKRSIVTGKLNVNSGANGIVTGLYNDNSGNFNIIGGGNNTISKSAQGCLVAGEFMAVNALYNTVGGTHNTVNAPHCLVVGGWNTVNAERSITCGLGNINNSAFSIVGGQFNVGKTNTLLEIGNGTDTAHRSNAFEVYTDGSISLDNGNTKITADTLKRLIALLK